MAPLRAALLTRIKPSVCGALKLLQQMLEAHPHAGRALRSYYDRLLIPMALYALSFLPAGVGIAFVRRLVGL